MIVYHYNELQTSIGLEDISLFSEYRDIIIFPILMNLIFLMMIRIVCSYERRTCS